MTTESHTPGPWKVDTEKDSHVIFIRGANPEKESIARIGKYSPDHNSVGNARLIASAPELLAALVGARKVIRKTLSFLPADKEAIFAGEWLDEINEVIATANGVNQ